MTNRVRKYAGGNLFSGPWRPRNGVQVYAGGEPIRSQYPSILHTSTSATWTATLKGPAGKYVTFDWGDGSAPTTLDLDTGGVDFVHDYSSSGSGTKVIRIYGDLDAVTFFDCRSTSPASDLISADLRLLPNLERAYFSHGNIIELLVDLNAPIDYFYLHNCSITQSFVNILPHFASTLTQIRISGNDYTDVTPFTFLINATLIQAYGVAIDYPLTGLTWFPATSGTFYWGSNVDSSAEVDQWLIDLAAANWSSCTIYLDGTNPARTSASDAAIATLAVNGCTVYVNE